MFFSGVSDNTISGSRSNDYENDLRDVCSETPMSDADASPSSHGNGHQAASETADADFRHTPIEDRAHKEFLDGGQCNLSKTANVTQSDISGYVAERPDGVIGGICEQGQTSSLSTSSPYIVRDSSTTSAVSGDSSGFGNGFNPQSTLINVNTCSGFKPYQCETSDATFSLISKQTHTGERPYDVSSKALSPQKTPLPSHVASEHMAKRYACELCDKRFKTEAVLKYHLNKHYGIKPFECGKCDATFANPQARACHLNTHTGVRPLQACKLCSRTFKSRSGLVTHVKTVHFGKKIICPLCHKGFTQSHNFKYHMNKHYGVRPFKCKKCAATFTGYCGMSSHMKTHFSHTPNEGQAHKEFSDGGRCKSKTPNANQSDISGNVAERPDGAIGGIWEQGQTSSLSKSSPYIVRNSSTTSAVSGDSSGFGNGFNPQNALINVNTCNGFKPYQCETSDATFSLISKQTHTGERPYDVSSKALSPQKTPLPSHVASEHMAKRYACELCDKRFKTESVLKYHLNKHYGIKPFECGKCDATFANPQARACHVNTHTGVRPLHACKLCSRTFMSSSGLRKHVMTVHFGRKFICPVCNKGFTQSHNFKHHMNKHYGVRPFKCKK